ncbi:MAG: biotin--[acetyl-CoA-carboxylase] ligase [Rhodospirillaceae bacterium]|nr:biotin--[acetyl-CoA-carboxylase] ligase [Rhodospirillaceae bacterium]
MTSTNDEAKRLAGEGAAPYTVICAQEQTGGRGRLDRRWISPPGNLYCSILLDGGPDAARAPQLSFVAALAVAETLTELAPRAHVGLKWPNDILCNGAKICGMLLERAGSLIVLGVGVNIASAPAPALYPAICLSRLGSDAESLDVLAGLCERLEYWVERWRSLGFAPVRDAWVARAIGVGGPIGVRLADGSVMEGIFYGLDEEGGLLLDTRDGFRRRVLAGDVFFTS